MTDPRFEAMLARFRTLTSPEIQRIQVELDRDNVCFDEFNFDSTTGKFCPIAIAMGFVGLHRTFFPLSDFEVKEAIGTRFQPVNILKGVPGEFYTTDRRRDLVNLCKFVLNERAQNKI